MNRYDGSSDRLILNFSELTQDTHEIEYASYKEAFLNQSIHKFVIDEVHSMLQLVFCEISWIATFWNPIYASIFIILFILTFPGALLHWLLLDFIPVRRLELVEEREIRTQGVYTTIGVSLFVIPFNAIGLYLGSKQMILINEISLAVNTSVIIICLLGLKAIADELKFSVRVFVIGAFIVIIFQSALEMFDFMSYLTYSWITFIEYILRVLEIIVFSIVASQSLQFWNMYRPKEKKSIDITYAIILSILYIGTIVGFLVAIFISQKYDWKIMSARN